MCIYEYVCVLALIDDETDKKPADWVDASSIPDPAAAKPEDWDESQPANILDPAAPSEWGPVSGCRLLTNYGYVTLPGRRLG